MPTAPIAIVSAMHEELRALLPLLAAPSIDRVGDREMHRGRLDGHPVILALSGIGKVAAAITATLLLTRGEPAALLFTGVAGGLGAGVEVGDIVVARSLLQHDLDASPLFPRFEVPLTGRSRFATDAALSDRLARSAAAVQRDGGFHAGWAGDKPLGRAVHEGLVVSGDRFVSSAAESAALRLALPDALAVEMEGAAVAQACAAFGCPCAVVRTISDRADAAAHVDFPRFIAEVASVSTRAVVGHWLKALQ